MKKEFDGMDCIAKQNLHKFEKSIVLSVLFIGFVLVFLATPAMAETGSFTSVGGLSSDTYYTTYDAPGYQVRGIYIKNIQNQAGLNSIFIVTDAGGSSMTDSNVTPVDLYIGTTSIGTGLFGYWKDGVTYHTYLFVYTFNPGTYTGDYYVNFTIPTQMSTWTLGNLVLGQTSHAVAGNEVNFEEYNAATGFQYKAYGIYSKYQSKEFRNDYVTSYSSPLSTIALTRIFASKPYPSKIYIMSGATVAASNTSLSADNYSTSIAGIPYYTINVTDMWNNWYVSSLIYPTGLPVYNISVIPTEITPIMSSSGGITSINDPYLFGLTDISWKWSDDTGTYNFYEGSNTSRLVSYTKKANTNWYGYEIGAGGLGGSYTLSKGTAVPNPVNLSNIPTTGIKTIICFIGTSDGKWYELTTNLTVSGGGEYITTSATMTDWLTGNRIQYGVISFLNLATGYWTNITPSTGDGTVSTSSTPLTMWNIYGSASGYNIGSLLGMPAKNGTYNIFMYPSANVTAALGNTTLYITATDDATLLGISGVSVSVSSVTDQSFFRLLTTPQSGSVSLAVPNNSEYWINLQARGYQGVTQKATIALEPMFSVNILLHRIPVTAQPTPFTVAPTPTVTLSGYQPAYGNFTGFWAPFENMGVAMGAQPSEVGVLMMFLLIIGFLILGGWAAGPLGAEVGVVAGMVCSVAFRFLPFAVSIAVIAVLCLYGALRIWGATH
jgi:hypothetical protein